MISEFICLDEFQKSEHESTYICSLPDPDPDSDFGMVICGYINIRERIGSKEFLIKIEMLDNFEKLCVGDTYQRERFLTDILYMLRQKVNFDPYHAKILLKDHVGNYVGNAYVLSKTVQGRKKYIEISGRKMKINLSKIIVIAGTNASGKSSLAIDLAKKYGGEIVSADSRQVYRGFDLCSGKVTKEEQDQVPHHLLDVCDIEEPYSVADYQKAAYEVIDQILQRGHIPFLVGGTGLYISSVVHGYDFQEETIDPAYRNALEKKSLEELQDMLSEEAKEVVGENNSDRNNKRRLIRLLEKTRNGEKLTAHNSPRYKTLQLGVTWEKSILHRRIDERLKKRLDQGMIDEVQSYLAAGNSPKYLYRLGLEYRYIADYLDGKYSSFEEFYDHLSQAIKRFAKRQMTWFRRDTEIHWLDMEQEYFDEACELLDAFYTK